MRKFMPYPTASDAHAAWSKQCVFGIAEEDACKADECLGCPFREEFEFQAQPKCKERNVRFLLVKSWVTTVVSVEEVTTLGIWAHTWLTEEQLEELAWKGEFKFTRHDHEHWHFYRLHALAKIMKGCRGDYWR